MEIDPIRSPLHLDQVYDISPDSLPDGHAMTYDPDPFHKTSTYDEHHSGSQRNGLLVKHDQDEIMPGFEDADVVSPAFTPAGSARYLDSEDYRFWGPAPGALPSLQGAPGDYPQMNNDPGMPKRNADDQGRDGHMEGDDIDDIGSGGVGPRSKAQQAQHRTKRQQVRVACTNCQKACKKCSNTR
jgi:hypothetical protein